MPPDDRDNLPLLYQTETFLKALSDTLARHELKQSSKVALPEAMVKGYITRLENQPVQGEVSSPVTLPAQALRSDAPDVQEHQTLPHSRLVYVVSETKAERKRKHTFPSEIPAHVSETVCNWCLCGIAGGQRGHSGMAVSDTAITGGAAFYLGNGCKKQ